MRLSTFWYCFKQGWINIYRNKLSSIASVATIAACIFLLCLFYSIIVNVQYVVQRAEESVDISVFFEKGLTKDEISALGDLISRRDEVEGITFISAEEAWDSYKDKYFAEAPELADGFAEDNPLANSASYEIRLNDITKQENFVEYLKGLNGVRRVNYSTRLAEGLTSLDNMISYISMAIIIILFGVSIFLINNSIATAIRIRQEEIKIMRLIGATNFMIRAPFIVEGLIIGIVGAAIPLVGIYYVYDRAIQYLSEKLQIVSELFQFLPYQTIMQWVIPMSLILGVGIGLFGSTFSIRKHLKV